MKDHQASIKYYSKRAISIGTFLGGPLAAGYLMRQNFLGQGKRLRGNSALFIGVALTACLIGVGLFLPEFALDQYWDILLPVVLTLMAYFIAEYYHGSILKEHEKNDGAFYSVWRAAGVGLVGLLIVSASTLGLLTLEDTLAPFDDEQYDQLMVAFEKNEKEALAMYDLTQSNEELLQFIQQTGIPAWRENLALLDEVEEMPGINPEVKERSQKLRAYCNLRIKSYRLIDKSVRENTMKYQAEIERLNAEITALVEKL